MVRNVIFINHFCGFCACQDCDPTCIRWLNKCWVILDAFGQDLSLLNCILYSAWSVFRNLQYINKNTHPCGRRCSLFALYGKWIIFSICRIVICFYLEHKGWWNNDLDEDWKREASHKQCRHFQELRKHLNPLSKISLRMYTTNCSIDCNNNTRNVWITLQNTLNEYPTELYAEDNWTGWHICTTLDVKEDLMQNMLKERSCEKIWPVLNKKSFRIVS